jgi:hypothetical protein
LKKILFSTPLSTATLLVITRRKSSRDFGISQQEIPKISPKLKNQKSNTYE